MSHLVIHLCSCQLFLKSYFDKFLYVSCAFPILASIIVVHLFFWRGEGRGLLAHSITWPIVSFARAKLIHIEVPIYIN
jgi:hypothetical protein